MPKYPENLIHFCRPVLEHYELSFEMGRMFVRSMRKIEQVSSGDLYRLKAPIHFNLF